MDLSTADLKIDRPQLYTTLIYEPYVDAEFFVLTVPSRSSLFDIELTDLDFTVLLEIKEAELESAVRLVINPSNHVDQPGFRNLLETTLSNMELRDVAQSEKLAVKYLTHAKIIPFEQSPVEGVSLADIAKASGTSLGAYVGFISVGPHPTPMLLLMVPAGMVICAAASGLAHGLEHVIRQKVVDIFGRDHLRGEKPDEKA